MRARLLFALPCLWASTALAQTNAPDTAATAARPVGTPDLERQLQDYLGPLPFDSGFLTIRPEGQTYRLTFGGGGNFGSEVAEGVSVRASVSPYSLLVSERPDGDWDVSGDGSIAASYAVEAGPQSSRMTYAINGLNFSGVFSPAIRTFLTSSGSIAETQVVQTDANGAEADVSLGMQSFSTTATPREGDTVDYAMTQTGRDFDETISVPMDPTQPGALTDITIRAKALNASMKAEAMQAVPITDLMAFLLRNASKEDITARQDELKQRLEAALPLWAEIDGDYALEDMSLLTPFGQATIGRTFLAFTGNGVETSGSYRYRVGFEDMILVFRAIPAWTAPLLPRDVAMDVVVRNVDLQTPTEILLANLDLASTPPLPEAAGEEIIATFHKQRPEIAFENVRIVARDYEVTIDGSVRFEGEVPATRFDIVATGLDTALKTLQEAGPRHPEAMQAFGFASMAKGFGKPLGDGRTQWLIETAADGSVKINGVQIKGPDAPQVPLPKVDPQTGMPL
ncbi:hypothetical protein [Jiella marina]|uniref:hypothetical protein n=1 Tax=Jiella sp. LLJ827 TaxID=2917712 RepID=UPI002100A070|nr:hypothetical protein [Jiella sp. LLJ827]MCQ0987257.1 hypothetical protein [Jiella sp. LLJ827]